MITMPEIICVVFSFLDKDQIEKAQLVNRFWNNVIVRHKNILPLRQFANLYFSYNQIRFYATKEDWYEHLDSYKIKFDGTNLSKGNVSSRYSQMTVDEVLNNLNDVVFDVIKIGIISQYILDSLLNMMKLVTTKIGGRFRGRYGEWTSVRTSFKPVEIFDNYIIVDELALGYDSYIREICANPEIVQLPSTPKKIRLIGLEFEENDEVLNFTCNDKLNGASRLTIHFWTSETNFGNFIRQWFKLYRTHENPISLVEKFELVTHYEEVSEDFVDSVLDTVKTFLNNSQLCVKYSLETKEFHSSFDYDVCQYVKRSCVLHETNSYALVIEMEYGEITDMSSINASGFDQPPHNKMEMISFCVKSL